MDPETRMPHVAETDGPASLKGPRSIVPNLKAAIRRARMEEAERAEVVAELRGAELARLEMLQEMLAPVLAQVPEGVDLFDTALVPGDHPRLFIDMVAFVEMGRDRRQYRFVQDTRYGRVIIAETERVDSVTEAVTDYIARRLVEREQALAGDRTVEKAARGLAEIRPRPISGPAERAAVPERRGSRFGRFLLGVLDVLGAIALFVVLAAVAYWGWKFGLAWWAAR